MEEACFMAHVSVRQRTPRRQQKLMEQKLTVPTELDLQETRALQEMLVSLP